MGIIHNINKTAQTLFRTETQSAEMPLIDLNRTAGKMLPNSPSHDSGLFL